MFLAINADYIYRKFQQTVLYVILFGPIQTKQILDGFLILVELAG
jgi:hypothetical protein